MSKYFLSCHTYCFGGIGIVWSHCNKWGDQVVVQREKYITDVDMIFFFPFLISLKCFYINKIQKVDSVLEEVTWISDETFLLLKTTFFNWVIEHASRFVTTF